MFLWFAYICVIHTNGFTVYVFWLVNFKRPYAPTRENMVYTPLFLQAASCSQRKEIGIVFYRFCIADLMPIGATKYLRLAATRFVCMAQIDTNLISFPKAMLCLDPTQGHSHGIASGSDRLQLQLWYAWSNIASKVSPAHWTAKASPMEFQVLNRPHELAEQNAMRCELRLFISCTQTINEILSKCWSQFQLVPICVGRLGMRRRTYQTTKRPGLTQQRRLHTTVASPCTLALLCNQRQWQTEQLIFGVGVQCISIMECSGHQHCGMCLLLLVTMRVYSNRALIQPFAYVRTLCDPQWLCNDGLVFSFVCIYLHAYLSIRVCLSDCLCLHVRLSILSVCVCMFICLSCLVSVCICCSSVCLVCRLSVSAYLSVCLSVCTGRLQPRQ